jgi:proline iminopeptidase
MAALYPEIEPYEHGRLDAGDGQLIYWEVCGSPNGKPAVVLHGGPGSGCTSEHRRYFDPAAYRVVLFDQRGAGQSLPHASDPTVDVSTNTTKHLIADIELLREHLGIARWLVWGYSWGSTLALAYAEHHPDRVTEVVLGSITMSRPAEIEWLYRGVGRFFPREWRCFQGGVPEDERDGDLVAAYHRLLNHPDPDVRARAVRDWCDWEDVVASMHPEQRNPRYDDPLFRLAFARIVTHYFHHRAWLEDGILLSEAHRLAGIPGVLVQGRLDLGSPPVTAWELAETWPDARLKLVGTGHTGGDEMDEHLVAATDRFADPEGEMPPDNVSRAWCWLRNTSLGDGSSGRGFRPSFLPGIFHSPEICNRWGRNRFPKPGVGGSIPPGGIVKGPR